MDFGGMKLFRYWRTREFSVLIDGATSKINCTAGSNVSLEDADARCEQKAKHVQNRIIGTETREQEYERPVREEIVQEIDQNNIVTRNRYGALILNTASLNIYDIDEYKKSFWEMLGLKFEFLGYKKDKKAAIVDELRKLYKSYGKRNSTWRIYETCKGIRLIVTGEYLATSSPEFAKFCKLINADYLYTWLCVRQHCCRARLTPKPFRMKIETIKYHCPIPEGEEEHYRNWVANYEQKSRNFAVCRLIEIIGSSSCGDAIVDYHDRLCCNNQATTLA